MNNIEKLAIEQLALNHGTWNRHHSFCFTLSQLEAFAKALQSSEPVADAIRALIDQPQPPASQELGWLIEKNINGVLHYVYCSEIGLLDWTNDNLKAMRFSRKQDADQLTNLIEDAERVAEHIWMG